MRHGLLLHTIEWLFILTRFPPSLSYSGMKGFPAAGRQPHSNTSLSLLLQPHLFVRTKPTVCSLSAFLLPFYLCLPIDCHYRGMLWRT